jgi:hypothetical protein
MHKGHGGHGSHDADPTAGRHTHNGA